MNGPAKAVTKPQTIDKVTLAAIAFCAAWIVGAAGLGTLGHFETPRYADHGRVIVAVLAPTVLFAIGFTLSPTVRTWVRSLDPAILVLPHAWRAVGYSFLLLWHFEVLPGAFAAPAGLGDMAIALAAVPIAIALWRGLPGAYGSATLFHILGILDFIAAITAGISGAGVAVEALSQTDPMTAFPLVYIPVVAVPLLLLGHAVALTNLAMMRIAQ